MSPAGVPGDPRWRRILLSSSARHLSAYVFLGPKGARPARSNFHTIWEQSTSTGRSPAAASARLRHTGNTLAAETGATLRELMERMGHRSTRAALIYLHARDHRDRAIADGLDTIVGTAALGGNRP